MPIEHQRNRHRLDVDERGRTPAHAQLDGRRWLPFGQIDLPLLIEHGEIIRMKNRLLRLPDQTLRRSA